MNNYDKSKPKVPPRIAVDIQTLENVVCSNCQCPIFTGAIELKKVPAVLSNTGKPDIAQKNVLVCFKCGQILNKTDVFAETKKVLI